MSRRDLHGWGHQDTGGGSEDMLVREGEEAGAEGGLSRAGKLDFVKIWVCNETSLWGWNLILSQSLSLHLG